MFTMTGGLRAIWLGVSNSPTACWTSSGVLYSTGVATGWAACLVFLLFLDSCGSRSASFASI